MHSVPGGNDQLRLSAPVTEGYPLQASNVKVISPCLDILLDSVSKC
jgi:hypothetical protein